MSSRRRKAQKVTKSVCRTCLSEKNDLDMQNIFNIADMLKSAIPLLHFERGDGLPTKICLNCLIEAHQAFRFQSLCAQSDATLRRRLLEKVEENIEETTNNYDSSSDSESAAEEEEQEDDGNVGNDDDDREEEKMDNDTYFYPAVKPIRESIESQMRANEKLICYCGIEFQTKTDLNNHKEYHLQELKCPLCEKPAENRKKFKRHMDMHREFGLYLCETCGKSFTYRYHLKRHERIHTGDKPYMCKICDKSFSQSAHLKTHQSSHVKERNHLCNICGKKFSGVHCLRQHIKNQHLTSPDDKPYVCVCGKSFKMQRELSRHQNTVHSAE